MRSTNLPDTVNASRRRFVPRQIVNRDVQMPDPWRGQHKVLIELVSAAHHLFDGCSQDCRHGSTFTVPGVVCHAH